MKTLPILVVVAAVASVLAPSGAARAAFLSDAQLYFDPDSITPDFYPRVDLPDLTTTHTFIVAAGTDPVTGANILPVLKPNNYTPGYMFTQNDYLQTPNVDYRADLTSGTLTADFSTAGIYELRVLHSSGLVQIFSVLAEAGLKEKDGAPDKLGAEMKLDPLPAADLVLVENSDSTLDDSAKIWMNGGRTVERVNSRADAVQKITDASKAAGRKIHVEIDGHGTSANISTGAGKSNIPDKQIDLTSVADFQKAIEPYVNNITFQGCSVGKGADGLKFLSILASSLGTAGAWDSEVTVVDQSYFTVNKSARFITVPEPPGLALLGLGSLTLLGYAARPRRGAPRRHPRSGAEPAR